MCVYCLEPGQLPSEHGACLSQARASANTAKARQMRSGVQKRARPVTACRPHGPPKASLACRTTGSTQLGTTRSGRLFTAPVCPPGSGVPAGRLGLRARGRRGARCRGRLDRWVVRRVVLVVRSPVIVGGLGRLLDRWVVRRVVLVVRSPVIVGVLGRLLDRWVVRRVVLV